MIALVSVFFVSIIPSTEAATFGDFEYQLIDSGNAVEITDYTGTGGAISIPSSIEGKPVTVLASYSFANTDVTSVVIPDSVLEVEDYAFDTCTDLVTVTIGNGVRTLGNYSFADCDVLTTVNMGDNVTTIGYSAFRYCTSLQSINLSSVVNLGNYAFLGCSGLTSVILGDGLLIIGAGTFYDCTSLPSIVIPDSVTSIGGEAFNTCESLVTVTIGNGVQTIGNYAFYYCDNLTTVIVGENVTAIGNWTFEGCGDLDNITFLGDAPTVGTDWINLTSSSLVIYYAQGATGFTNPWEGTETVMIEPQDDGSDDPSEETPADDGWMTIVIGVIIAAIVAVALAWRFGYI